jgi:hypothetical protein
MTAKTNTYDAAHVEILKAKLSAETKALKATRLALGDLESTAMFLKRHVKAIGSARKPPKINVGKSHGVYYEAVLMLSDFHFPEVVRSDETSGFGNYGPEICLDRLWTLVSKVIKITSNERKASKIGKLWVMLMGDICSGMIHEELMRSSPIMPLQAATQIGHILAQAITLLADHYPDIEIVVVPGNHGRIERGWTYKSFAANNLDMLSGDIMAAYLQKYIQTGRVKVNMSTDMEAIVVINGHPFLVGHGNGIKSFGGVASYGILKDTTKQALVRSYQGAIPEAKDFKNREEAVDWARNILGQQQFQYRLLGHWHEFNAMNNCRIIMNGSLIGANEFSFNSSIKGTAEPVQVFMLVSKDFLPSPLFPIQLLNDVKRHKFSYDASQWGSSF